MIAQKRWLLNKRLSLSTYLALLLILAIAVVFPFAFLHSMRLVYESNKGHFFEHVRETANLIGTFIDNVEDQSKSSILNILEDAMVAKEILLIQLIIGEEIIAPPSLKNKHLIYIEDQDFNQHGDHVFYFSISLNPTSDGKNVNLRFGFDEEHVNEMQEVFFNNFVLIFFVYFLIATVIIVVLTRLINRPIYLLAAISKAIAQGKINKQLNINTNIEEIHNLANDLEKMRRALVHQASQLEKLSQKDVLTGIPNRMVFNNRLSQMAVTSKKTQIPFALLVMDLDGFKEINDSIGHHAGDLVIQEVALRLYGIIYQSDTVARLGGDEFAILLHGLYPEEIEISCKKITEEIKQPFNISGQMIYVGVSIGISCFPKHSEDPTEMMLQADIAMYYAKKNNFDYYFYDTSLQTDNLDLLKLRAELSTALEKGQFQVYYQPVLQLKTKKIIGFEALLRWQTADGKIKLPDFFIPICEKMGSMINHITSFVLEQVLTDAWGWHQQGYLVKISVNISPKNLLQSTFTKEVMQLLKKKQFKPEFLQLELTEHGILAEPLKAIGLLRELAEKGVKIIVDDFGTGYSSLAYLKKLPISTVKIDRSFIFKLLEDSDNAAIAKATIDMAHNIGLEVAAEGIESVQALSYLDAWGCDLGQGVIISEPVTAESAFQILEKDFSEILK